MHGLNKTPQFRLTERTRLTTVVGTDINHADSLILFLSSSQAVGHCDGNDAQTELFQIYDVGPDGERANVRRQYHFKNGTVVDVTAGGQKLHQARVAHVTCTPST